MKVLIINCQKSQFIDKKTGEVVGFTKTVIGLPTTETKDFVGYLVEEFTGKIADFDIIAPFVNKVVDVEFDFKKNFGDKNYCKKLYKVGESVLSAYRT